MTARILVVDDVPANVKLLEARLSAEYYDVVCAVDGPQALAICADGSCDIVLLDVMMPGMDGFEVCRRLKADPATLHIPVVMVTALDQPSDRVKGLKAGADDFLTKPIDELALLARVRSLARLKLVVDELRDRAATSLRLGITDPVAATLEDTGDGARIMLVEDRSSAIGTITAALRDMHHVEVEADPQQSLFKAVDCEVDLVIVSLGLADYDGLRLCSQLRALERTRHVPVLLLADLEDRARIVRGLDLGVNDYLVRPIDRDELRARVRTQVRRKRYADRLRDNVQASIEAAVVDALTGLHNRRYLENHLAALIAGAADKRRPLSLMVLDIDHFKSVNDRFGHDAGDQVLKVFAGRVRKVVRNADLFCRLGGEEFVVVMPDTRLDVAHRIAERVRATVERDLFAIEAGGRTIPVTVSIGLAERGDDVLSEGLVRRADQALYRAKSDGRNRVSAAA